MTHIEHPPFVPYEIRVHYPHLMPRDRALWERFLVKNPDTFRSVAYDVPVGDGADFDTVVSQETGGDAAKLYKKKIDVVGENEQGIFIIEIKPEAGPSTLGQVDSYATLYARDFIPSAPIHRIIITDTLKPDMEFLAKDFKTSLYIV